MRLILEVWRYSRPKQPELWVEFRSYNRGEVFWHNIGLLFLTWINNYIHYKVWDEITYPFPNFNGAMFRSYNRDGVVWRSIGHLLRLLTWINNYIHHKVWDEITYPFPNFNGAMFRSYNRDGVVWRSIGHLLLLLTWMNNYIHYKVWDEITYPLPNFNGAEFRSYNRDEVIMAQHMSSFTNIHYKLWDEITYRFSKDPLFQPTLYCACDYLSMLVLKLSISLNGAPEINWNMMTSSNGNIFALLAFVRGIHRPPVNSPHKGQWRGALMFSLICV